MKKCFLVMVALGAFAASADDSYLYWMVNTDDGTAAKFEYDTVQVRAYETAAGVDSGNYLMLYYGNGNEAGRRWARVWRGWDCRSMRRWQARWVPRSAM